MYFSTNLSFSDCFFSFLSCSGFLFSTDSLFITQIKERSIIEWLDAIMSPKKDQEMYSAFTDHYMSVALMSGIYRSYCKKQLGIQPVELIPWRD